MSALRDMNGVLLVVGQTVAKPTRYGASAIIEVRHVTRIENGKVYLDTKVPLQCPERLLVLS